MLITSRPLNSVPVRLALLGTATALLIGSSLAGPTVPVRAAETTNISVDFTEPKVASPRQNFGFTFSTFGDEGGPVPSNPADIASLKRLSAGTVRLHLEPGPDGSVISGADGGATSISGDRWVDVIEELGAEPIVIVNADRADALAVLNYLNTNGHNVKRFIIGNEMDANSKSNLSDAAYTNTFKSIAAAMRQVTPGLQIGGPAPAWFNTGLMQTFINGAVKNATPLEKASFIDFHAYGSGEGDNATMAQSTRYSSQIDELRAMIGDPSVGIQVGEFNMNWGNESQNNTHFASVWNANAFGTIISKGATALVYADKNRAMGLTGPGGTPKASYVGMAMFTGQVGGLRHFGETVVASSSSDPNVRVYASARSNNIVVVNTGGATSANIAMTGASSGSVEQWQIAGALATVHPASLVNTTSFSGGRVVAPLPGMSITTFVVNPAGATTPVPAPAPAPAAPAPAPAPAAPAPASAPAAPAPAPAPAPAAPAPAPAPMPSAPVSTPTVPGLADSRWRVAGSAVKSAATGTLTTAARKYSAGSIYYDIPVAAEGLNTSFDVSISGGNGGDGMTFALLNPSSSRRVGGSGGGLGYSGLSGTAVVLDTFNNFTNKLSGTIGIARSAAGSTFSYLASNTSVGNLRTRHHYDVTVAGGVLTVKRNGVIVVRSTVTLPEKVILAFTGGTGSSTDAHKLYNVVTTTR